MFNKEVLDSLSKSRGHMPIPVKDFVSKLDFYSELVETLKYMRQNEILDVIKFPSNAKCVNLINGFALEISINSEYMLMQDHVFVFNTTKGMAFGTPDTFHSMGIGLSDPEIIGLINEFDRIANNLYEQIQKLKAE